MCALCGGRGESHQLESCPNLPSSTKIEVLVERFDAQGVSYANKSQNQSIPPTSKPIDTWVTVTPKKRMCATKASKVVNSMSKAVNPPIVKDYSFCFTS